MRDDFTLFFRRKQFYGWDSSVSNRWMAWEAWIENKITFREACCLMLPAWTYPSGLRKRFKEYKKISAKRLCLFYLETDGSFYLQGKRFMVFDDDYEKMIHIIRMVIVDRKILDGKIIFTPEDMRHIEKASNLIAVV